MANNPTYSIEEVVIRVNKIDNQEVAILFTDIILEEMFLYTVDEIKIITNCVRTRRIQLENNLS